MVLDLSNTQLEQNSHTLSNTRDLFRYDQIANNLVKRSDQQSNTLEQATGEEIRASQDQGAALEEPVSFGSTGFRKLIRDAQVKLNDTEFEAFLSGSINSYDRYILAAETFEDQAENTRGGSYENLVAVGVGAAITGAASLYVLGRIGMGKLKPKTAEKKPDDPSLDKQIGGKQNPQNPQERLEKSVNSHNADPARADGGVNHAIAKSIGTKKTATTPGEATPKTPPKPKPDDKKDVKGKGLPPGAGQDVNTSDSVESLTPYFQALNILGGLGNSVGSNIGQFLKSEEDADNSELQGHQSALRALAESLKGLQDHSSESLASSLQSLGKFLEQVTQAQGSVASAITV